MSVWVVGTGIVGTNYIGPAFEQGYVEVSDGSTYSLVIGDTSAYSVALSDTTNYSMDLYDDSYDEDFFDHLAILICEDGAYLIVE